MNIQPILATTALLMGVAGIIHAEDSTLHPYVGIDANRVMVDYKTYEAYNISGKDLLKDSLNGISPYAGVQFNKYLGAEISYLATASAKKSNILNSGVDSTVKVSGISADLVGTFPVTQDEKVALLGSAGIGRYHAKIGATYNGASASASENDTGYRAGVGVQYQLTDNVGVRAMARYTKVDFDKSTNNLVTASLGVNYKF